MPIRADLVKLPLVTFAAGALAIAAWEAGSADKTPEPKKTDYRFFDELIEVKHLINSQFVNAPDDEKLKQGAIKGMVEALDDQYTVYVPAADQREFNKSLTGEYVGIGAQVNTADGWLTIVSPLEDAPAFRAGLLPEDRVLEINGVTTQGVEVEKCVEMLSGKGGTPVTLKIDRKGQTLEITIVREKIKTRSVKGFHRDPADPQRWEFVIDPIRKIAYVRVTQFTPKLAEELLVALRAVKADVAKSSGGLGGLVLDLRFNPGGLLSEAEAIADLFLQEGVIVSTKGRAYEERVSRAVTPGTLPEFPIIVMINGESASASEILAGALVENDRAVALGTRSFGKGSVQSLIKLQTGTGSELKLTEQGYYLPSGRSLSRKDDSAEWGVDPTPGFFVPVTDKQVGEMIAVRRKQELLAYKPAEGAAAAAVPSAQPAPAEPTATTPAEPAPTPPMILNIDWTNTDAVLDTLKDIQLSAAVRAMQAKIDTGEWKKTGEEGPQRGAIAASELAKARQFRERLVREALRVNKRIDALEVAAKDAGEDKSRDFWADDKDLAGGTLEVRDKDGKVVSTLRITGNNLERWLLDADVEKPKSTAEEEAGKAKKHSMIGPERLRDESEHAVTIADLSTPDQRAALKSRRSRTELALS